MGPAAAIALAAASAALPFHIVFTEGRCRGCEAPMLGSIQFSDGAVLWAQGYSPPGGEVGLGEWTLLASRDGGRLWRELHKTWSWSHNIETRAFFDERSDGWIEVPNSLGAEPYYASTSDGGRRWRPVHAPSSFVVNILYRGHGRGAAYANNQYEKKSTFFVTRDNGRHWRASPIGSDMWIDQFAYSGPNTPVLAGCLNDQTVILASLDGGSQWTRTNIPEISPTSKTVGCEAMVDGLAFRPDKSGFALVQRHSFPLTRTDGYASLWRTPDGGEHWTKVFFESHPADGPQARWLNGPYVLGDLTLVFVSGDSHDSVLYSRNDGESWSSAPLPTRLSGCFAGQRSLTCMAGSKGFRIAILTRLAGPRVR
jgi:photosystem II stability/assembly factor-like uncharacterized protein